MRLFTESHWRAIAHEPDIFEHLLEGIVALNVRDNRQQLNRHGTEPDRENMMIESGSNSNLNGSGSSGSLPDDHSRESS